MPDFANSQALNRYSYVYNNPLRYTDPSGHDPWWLQEPWYQGEDQFRVPSHAAGDWQRDRVAHGTPIYYPNRKVILSQEIHDYIRRFL